MAQYTIDAKNKKLGRVASEISGILQGKKTAHYEPRLAGSDTVVVVNAGALDFSKKKLEQKVYHRHTGYMGHVKTRTLRQAVESSPAKVLRHAVERMLPKNALRYKRMRRLAIT